MFGGTCGKEGGVQSFQTSVLYTVEEMSHKIT